MAINKIDSNVTGLRYAKELSLGVLPGTLGADAIWKPLEPNSYSDFGGQISTIARNPINATRQRKKGVTTDLDASGGFNQDLTFDNTTDLLQGFFFAAMREKATSAPINGAAVAMTAIVEANDDYTAAAGLPTTILSSALVYASGFGVAANNGLKTTNGTSTATAITVAEALTAEATPPAAAKVQLVGHQFVASDAAITMNGNLARLTSAAVTMTTLPLLVGEWIYIGGDGALTHFANNQGFARISAIAAGYLEFDKTSWEPTAEAAGSFTIQIFYGSVIRNEPAAADIVRTTYQLERTLGNDDNGVMSEYLIGACANELSINVSQADKVTIDLSFVAIDNEQRNGTTGVKDGTRTTLAAANAFNTSSDFSRIKLASVSAVDASVVPLFAFSTEMTLTINNNVTPNKAIGVLGAFDTTAGTFEVGGSVNAYFASIEAVEAVRNNGDITLDFVLVKDNRGLLFDVPLLALGNGRLAVEQDQAITLPLETNAAESSFGYTLLFQSFPYLPSAAA
jgi:hypothetical protein